MILIIASAIIVSIVVVLMGFVLFGIIYRPKPIEIFVDPREGKLGKYCTRERVKCSTQADCDKICNETGTIELDCVQVDRYNDEQVKLFGPAGSYCLPKQLKPTCIAEHGGVLAWSGYAGVDNMEWDCLCTYPGYYGDEGCQNLNAGICSKNPAHFKWDATKPGAGPPGADNCTCPKGTYKMTSQEGQVPKCVPGNVMPSYYKSNMQYPSRCSLDSDCPPNGTCVNGGCTQGTLPGLKIKNNTNSIVIYVGLGSTAYFSGSPTHGAGPSLPLINVPIPKGMTVDLSKYISYISIHHNYVTVFYGRINNYPLHNLGWIKLGGTYVITHHFNTIDLPYLMKNNTSGATGITFYWGALIRPKTAELTTAVANNWGIATISNPHPVALGGEVAPGKEKSSNLCFGTKASGCIADISKIDTSQYYLYVGIFIGTLYPILARGADMTCYVDLFTGNVVKCIGETTKYRLTAAPGNAKYMLQLSLNTKNP